MTYLIRTSASTCWLLLTGLTVVSWAFGTQDGLFGLQHAPASLLIIVVAIFKLRLVGLYFMDLRTAPRALRGAFEAYCVVLLCLLSGMYAMG